MATNKEKAGWLLMTMNIEAENMFGEFGFDTCSELEKAQVIEQMIEDGMFKYL